MVRVGFSMKIKDGKGDEYKKRHDEVWPEISEELKKAGVYDYSIFLDKENNTLFASQKLTDNNTADELAFKPIMRKWWGFNAELMETNEDNSPIIRDLEEVFYFE
jgi:L-rhamnose mutarotase